MTLIFRQLETNIARAAKDGASATPSRLSPTINGPVRVLFRLGGIGGLGVSWRANAICGAAFVAAQLSAASAGDIPSKTASPPSPNAMVKTKSDWEIEVGAFGLFSPKFFGAKDSKFSPIPYVSINYKDIVFASIDKGAGVNIISVDGFKAGAFLNYRDGREEKESRQYLAGLGDVDPTVTAGAFIRYEYERVFATELKFEKGLIEIGGDDKNKRGMMGLIDKTKGNLGVRIDWSADFRLPLFDNRLVLSAGPRVSFFDKEYAESEYGVTVAQSLASGYRAFKPKSGIGEVGVGGSARYRITDNMYATAFGGYTKIVGDAAKSPIVTGRGGSKDQFKAGIGLTYRFGL